MHLVSSWCARFKRGDLLEVLGQPSQYDRVTLILFYTNDYIIIFSVLCLHKLSFRTFFSSSHLVFKSSLSIWNHCFLFVYRRIDTNVDNYLF